MSRHLHPVCGRCGVYRHLHPRERCEKSRRSYWWDEHYLHRHAGAWLWIHAVPSRLRWRILERIASDRRDWCELADSALQADQWDEFYRNDYRGDMGCLCDFPMPWDAGPSRPGWCYCTPAQPS